MNIASGVGKKGKGVTAMFSDNFFSSLLMTALKSPVYEYSIDNTR